MWFGIVALVDKVCARGCTTDQALLLAIFLSQLALDLLNFTLQGFYLALSFIKLIPFRLNHFFLCSELLFLSFHIFFFPLGVLKIALESTLP